MINKIKIYKTFFFHGDFVILTVSWSCLPLERKCIHFYQSFQALLTQESFKLNSTHEVFWPQSSKDLGTKSREDWLAKNCPVKMYFLVPINTDSLRCESFLFTLVLWIHFLFTFYKGYIINSKSWLTFN